MGSTTDFIGHIDIYPTLNDAEQAYLQAFSRSRRWDREEGPYVVPGNPAAEEQDWDGDRDSYNRTAPGQPELYCQWVPCLDGCCLAFDGYEKFYEPVGWMRYLIDHFLRPGAHASTADLRCFDEFTFDHVLEGMVVGCRRNDKELFAIRVENNEVSEEILRPADARLEEREALAYEAYMDSERDESPRPRPRPRRRPRSSRPTSGSSADNVIRLMPK